MKKKLLLLTSVFSLSLCLFFYNSFKRDVNAIKLSGGITSESQILMSLVEKMIVHYTDYPVKPLNNLASANIVHQAMLNEEVDIATTRYTGTDLLVTLKLPLETNPEKAFQIVEKEFIERFNQQWFPGYGFSNQFMFMVTQETAEKYNLKKISDLKNYDDKLTVGVDTAWYKRKGDGYQAFSKEYDIDFKRVYPMQIGLVYDAVAAGELDVVLGYSTDGRVGSYNLVMLEDDLKFFPPYTAAMIARIEVLEQYPELEKVLLRLENKIDTETMQRLNYEADNDLVEPSIVAQRFLEENNYFEEEYK